MKATPRKGRSREVEEERRLKAEKKLVFVAEEGEKDAPTSPVFLESPLPIVGADPKDGATEVNLVPVVHCEGEGKSPMQNIHLPASHEGTFYDNVVCNDDVIGDSSGPNGPTQSHYFVFNSLKKSAAPPSSNVVVSGDFNVEKPFIAKKSRGNKWKRFTRDELIDKGEFVSMDTDETNAVNKRISESEFLGDESVVGATKRTKLSPMHELSSDIPAEVGVPQPHLSL